MSDPMRLLYDTPWMFAVGDFVDRHGNYYRIVAHAIEEATGTPVYVYSGVGGDAFVTWTRPRAEVEDGHFTRVFAVAISEVPHDDPLRREHAELVDALTDLACQHLDWDGKLDSGCLSANAHALRLLARLGRVRLTQDGPGRNVAGVFVEGA